MQCCIRECSFCRIVVCLLIFFFSSCTCVFVVNVHGLNCVAIGFLVSAALNLWSLWSWTAARRHGNGCGWVESFSLECCIVWFLILGNMFLRLAILFWEKKCNEFTIAEIFSYLWCHLSILNLFNFPDMNFVAKGKYLIEWVLIYETL